MFIEDIQKWSYFNDYHLKEESFGYTVFTSNNSIIGSLINQGLCFKFVSSNPTTNSSYSNTGYYTEDPSTLVSTSFSVTTPNIVPATNKDLETLNLNWFPIVAKSYKLSTHINDFLLIPTPAMFIDIPNVKGDCISLEEIMSFNREHGLLRYETFQRKPTFIEHQHLSDPCGIIIDSSIVPIKEFGDSNIWMLVLLMGFDKVKFPTLTSKLMSGEYNTFSVGFKYDSYICSICGKKFTQMNPYPCSHTQVQMVTYATPNNELAFKYCLNPVGFECSVVKNPAFSIAQNEKVLGF